jgi:glycolate oxidase
MPLSPHTLKALEDIVGKENLVADKEDLLCYSYDAGPLFAHLPDAVVRPRDAVQISQIMALANRERFPVTVRGSGTGITGGAIPIQGGLLLDLMGMNRILEINAEDLYCVVEPGVVTSDIHKAVEKLGLLYPPDPASQDTSTIGGNVAECAGGLRGLKYGVTKDYVLALEVVAPTGEIYQTGAKTVKSVTGYDLTKLLIGSEGTLGVITKIVLKLLPAPRHKVSCLAVYDRLGDAGDTVSRIIANRIICATLEIMDGFTIEAVERHKKIGLPVGAAALLLIEVDGNNLPALEEEMQAIKKVCEECSVREARVATTAAERDKLWLARRAIRPSLTAIKPTVVSEDVTVPRSKVTAMLEKASEISRKHGIAIAAFGHAGDGNLHIAVIADKRVPGELEKVEHAVDDVFSAALSLGGTLSGEHGIGLAKAKYLEREVGKAGIEMFRRIKRAMDPNNILNPGKMALE